METEIQGRRDFFRMDIQIPSLEDELTSSQSLSAFNSAFVRDPSNPAFDRPRDWYFIRPSLSRRRPVFDLLDPNETEMQRWRDFVRMDIQIPSLEDELTSSQGWSDIVTLYPAIVSAPSNPAFHRRLVWDEIPRTFFSSSHSPTDPTVAGRQPDIVTPFQTLSAFNSDIVTTPSNPASHRRPVWDFIQRPIFSSSHSPTDPIVASGQPLQADFHSYRESLTTLASDRPLQFVVNFSSSSSYFHRSEVHNQNTTQCPPNSTRVEGQPHINRARFIETLLAITAQAAQTILTVQTSGGSTSFSQNQKILFCCSAAFNVIGFLSFFFVILERGRRPGIARILRGTGFICTAYAFIGIMGMLLNDNIMLWVTGLAGVALFPVFASAFVK